MRHAGGDQHEPARTDLDAVPRGVVLDAAPSLRQIAVGVVARMNVPVGPGVRFGPDGSDPHPLVGERLPPDKARRGERRSLKILRCARL
jgi:hypothetical protein